MFNKEKCVELARRYMWAITGVIATVATAAPASATLDTDLTNTTTVITFIFTNIQTVIGVFTSFPLVIFVGMAVVYGIFRLVQRVIRGMR